MCVCMCGGAGDGCGWHPGVLLGNPVQHIKAQSKHSRHHTDTHDPPPGQNTQPTHRPHDVGQRRCLLLCAQLLQEPRRQRHHLPLVKGRAVRLRLLRARPAQHRIEQLQGATHRGRGRLWGCGGPVRCGATSWARVQGVGRCRTRGGPYRACCSTHTTCERADMHMRRHTVYPTHVTPRTPRAPRRCL
jgi:hypothetical protein